MKNSALWTASRHVYANNNQQDMPKIFSKKLGSVSLKKSGIITAEKWSFPKITTNNIIQYSPNECYDIYSNPNSRENTHKRHHLSQNTFQNIKK
jgi:hypothetical protein